MLSNNKKYMKLQRESVARKDLTEPEFSTKELTKQAYSNYRCPIVGIKPHVGRLIKHYDKIIMILHKVTKFPPELIGYIISYFCKPHKETLKKRAYNSHISIPRSISWCPIPPKLLQISDNRIDFPRKEKEELRLARNATMLIQRDMKNATKSIVLSSILVKNDFPESHKFTKNVNLLNHVLQELSQLEFDMQEIKDNMKLMRCRANECNKLSKFHKQMILHLESKRELLPCDKQHAFSASTAKYLVLLRNDKDDVPNPLTQSVLKDWPHYENELTRLQIEHYQMRVREKKLTKQKRDCENVLRIFAQKEKDSKHAREQKIAARAWHEKCANLKYFNSLKCK